MGDSVPVQFFSRHPVVLESICNLTTGNRLQNEGNTTECLNNVLDGLRVKIKDSDLGVQTWELFGIFFLQILR